jgi:two-component sensor histidine kinase
MKLVVADDGRGIAKEVQFPKTVGLGMHIVAMMVQRLLAGLSVTHVHGTCFTLTLEENTARTIAGDQNR